MSRRAVGEARRDTDRKVCAEPPKPVGKWGAATYTLSRIVTEEATPPTPYAPMMPMALRLVRTKKRQLELKIRGPDLKTMRKFQSSLKP